MCGIFGVSQYNKATYRTVDFLAYEMESRGPHSWGVTDGSRAYKALGMITDTWVRQPSYNQLIGHCRFATHGEHTLNNQHPFAFETPDGKLLVGIHNGTLSNHVALNHKYNRDFEVDSQHIMAHLALGKDLSDIYGSAVVAYYLDGELHLARFNSTNLFVAATDHGIVFASTESAVRKACRMGRLAIRASIPTKENMIYRVQGHELFEVREAAFGRTVYVNYFSSAAQSYAAQSAVSNASATTSTCLVCADRLNSVSAVVCKPCLQRFILQLYVDDHPKVFDEYEPTATGGLTVNSKTRNLPHLNFRMSNADYGRFRHDARHNPEVFARWTEPLTLFKSAFERREDTP